MLHLRASDTRTMPWKDGGGATTELAIEPAGATLADPFLWRLSSARVEAAGPFSRFPGRARLLALLEGEGLILDVEGQGRLRLKPGKGPLAFPGDPAAFATLIQGPCVDLGLIFDPGRVEGSLALLELGPDATALTLAPTTLLYAVRGAVGVDPRAVQLGPGELLRFDGEAGAKVGLRALADRATLAVVHLHPRA